MRIILSLLITLLPAALVHAQGLEYVRSHYTKYEYKVPMRDGVHLFTSVYVPKDHSKTYPILLQRTPYTVSPYGVDRFKENLGPSPDFGRSGYIVAYQDVRGRWMSEGDFVNMRPILPHDGKPGTIDESTDAYDTIDWLIHHVSPNNGRVGMWGISYPGFYTDCALVDSHPALKAASPQAPVTDWFIGDDWHHNGAFFLPHAFNFLSSFGHPRPKPTTEDRPRFDYHTRDGYAFYLDLGPLPNANKNYFHDDVSFWNDIMDHPTYDDFWKARNIRPHLKNVNPSVLTVGGWFDAENLFGALETYKQIERSSPSTSNRLVMGPWHHGGWAGGDGDSLGDTPFHVNTAEFFRTKIEFPFFETALKAGETSNSDGLPEAYVFETGRNTWRRFDSWPPKSSTRGLYLHPDRALSFDPPSEMDDASDSYVNDPSVPVPYLDDVTIGMTRDYMITDQRFASRRPDVLTYRTEPLETDLTIAGPIPVELHVSSSGTDADFIVKLIDVYPDDFPDPSPNPSRVVMGGFQQFVRGDVFRARFRDSFENPEPLPANEPVKIAFTLQDTLHTFRSGHRVMVQVQSSWFPLVDRNPQKFVDIYKANPEDFQKATQKIYRSADRPTHLDLPVLTAP